MSYEYLSFRLPDNFVEPYADVRPRWGFDIGGGNSLSELTYVTKYSRLKDDDTKERWHESVQRWIEGMYSILKDHCTRQRIPWNETKALRSAMDAYDRAWAFKWLPPGRGMAQMGTRLTNEEHNSAPLQNCSFVSTEKISTRSVKEAILPFTRLMEMSMYGVGVGFDDKGAGKLQLHAPNPNDVRVHVVGDSREGWVESQGLLLESYLFENRPTWQFDYSQIREAGSVLKRFGGHAAGPGPLIDLHAITRQFFQDRDGDYFTEMDIGNVMNAEGKCVVAGGNRRSAEIWLGSADNKEFLNAKNWTVNPERMGPDGWGHLSNNSVFAEVGGNYDHLVDLIAANGEPGLYFMDLARSHGRLADPPNDRDYRVAGINPCGEQPLESFELCTLVETYPHHNESFADFRQTLKHAYLYAKAVTLLPTPWPESNEIMQRNRRIGCSISGVVQFVEDRGIHELREWLDAGYEFICHRDQVYSEWLGIRESIKKTSGKPSGTNSIVSGATPAVHWPTDVYYIRRQRFNVDDPAVPVFVAAGYHVEPASEDPQFSVVVEFPTMGPEVRTEKEVSVWEKAHLAALAQRFWSDNAISVTMTFMPEEANQIGPIIRNFDGQLKSMSFLPITDAGAYPQMPYESITREEWEKRTAKIKPLDLEALYRSGREAEGEKYCTTDKCLL